MAKKNTLTSAELFKLARVIESRDDNNPEPYEGWREAERALSRLMGRWVSKSNIVTAATNCEVDVNRIVKPTRSGGPMANVWECIHALEDRVSAIETALK